MRDTEEGLEGQARQEKTASGKTREGQQHQGGGGKVRLRREVGIRS